MPRGGVPGHHNYPKGRVSRGRKAVVVAPLAPVMVAPIAPKAKGVGRGHGKHHHGVVPKAHHSHLGAHHPHRKKVK